MGVPVVVVTHTIPPEWDYEGSSFTFVTDDIESAIAIASEIAGNKKYWCWWCKYHPPVLEIGLAGRNPY